MIRPRSAALLLTVMSLGCGPEPFVEHRLVGAEDVPMVLVERRQIALPDSGPGNRFVSGWLFEKKPSGIGARPAGRRARLEIVHLVARPRTLSLEALSAPGRQGVSAWVGSRRLETRTLPSKIEISLPDDLALGRSLIDIEFSDPATVHLGKATLSTAVSAGRLEIDGEDLVQSPWSTVELILDAAPGSRLVGEFHAPSDPQRDQRFGLSLVRGNGTAEEVFESRPGASREFGPERFEVALGVGSPIKLRLSAEGKGAPGTWSKLRVRSAPRPAKQNAFPPTAPKVVLLYVMDALRADAVGHLSGGEAFTPCMDRLAAEGVVFSNHFSVAPNTGPATAALFTGYGFLRGRSIPEDRVATLAGDFGRAGYRTVSVSSNPHLSPDFGLTRGFDEVLFVPIDEDHGSEAPPTVNDSADRVHQAALEWLDRTEPEQSLFLYLHTLNPHNPYTPPEPFPGRFVRTSKSQIDATTRTLADIRDGRRAVSSEDRARIREWYAAGVAYNDHALCGFLDQVTSRVADEALVIVTSDHGEELFDHGGVLHGHTLYDELLHVPLVLWWPGHIAPAVHEQATGTLDLTESLRELIDSRAALSEGGRSLWPLVGGQSAELHEPRPHFATAPGLRRAAMARSDRFKLILVPRPRFAWGMGQTIARTHDAEYVFELVRDPEERVNLAGSGELEVDLLRSRLRSWVQVWEARQPGRDDAPLDEETRRRLEALGYSD